MDALMDMHTAQTIATENAPLAVSYLVPRISHPNGFALTYVRNVYAQCLRV